MSFPGFLRRSVVDRLLGIEPLYAHCDVPCGIYDPHLASLAAKTVHTMVKKVTDLPCPGADASPAQFKGDSLATREPMAAKRLKNRLSKCSIID